MSLRYSCPDCDGEITVRFLAAGEAAQCPHCGADSTVPEGAESIDAPSTRAGSRYAGAPFSHRTGRRSGSVGRRPPPKYTMFRALGWIILVGAIIHASLTMIGLLALSDYDVQSIPAPIFVIFLFLVLYVVMAIGVAQGIWAVLEIVANTRAVLPPPVDAFD